jgi:hypothetical protein
MKEVGSFRSEDDVLTCVAGILGVEPERHGVPCTLPLGSDGLPTMVTLSSESHRGMGTERRSWSRTSEEAGSEQP